jgi:carboxymethylenebutenolidase
MPLDNTPTNDEILQSSDLKSMLPATNVTRRMFVAGAAVTSGLALSVRPARASMIKTSMDGLRGGMINIPTSDGSIPGYMAMPATGTNHPVILVVQEIFGVHEHIKDVCRRLAKQGHLAIAPEMYHRQGDASKYTFKQIRQLIGEVVAKVPDKQVMSDLDATVKFAARNNGDADKLAITGFCWGGRVVWMYAAHNPNVKAGVAWYGRIIGRGQKSNTPTHPIDVAGKIKSPILGLYGGKDGGIPVDTVRQMEAKVKASGNPNVEIVIYPDAPHAFHADYRPSYREAAAKDGWKRLSDWLKIHGAA